MKTGMSREQEVLEALRTVMDPELGVDIVNLGLVYRVAIQGDDVQVDITVTSACCPLGSYLAEEAELAVSDLEWVEQVEVDVILDPPWDASRMSDEARRMLGGVSPGKSAQPTPSGRS